MDYLAEYIFSLTNELKFSNEDDKSRFAAETLGLFIEDLIDQLYNVAEYADLIELFEDEISGLSDNDEIVAATKSLVRRIPEPSRSELIAKSFGSTKEKLEAELIKTNQLTVEDAARITTAAKALAEQAELAEGLKDDNASAADKLSGLAA